MDYNDDDFIEKHDFVEAIMIAVEEAGYANPGYYVDLHYGDPTIFDESANPRRSIACDSPTAIICDLAKVIEEDR